jgi:hypothetical protein
MRARLHSIAIALLAGAIAAAVPPAAATTTLRVAPAAVAAVPGAVLTFDVRIDTPEQVGALQFTLDYHANVLQFQSAEIGGDLEAEGMGISFLIPDPSFDPVTAGATANLLIQIHGGPTRWFTGNDVLAARVTFVVQAAWCETSAIVFDPTCIHTHVATFQLDTICSPALALQGATVQTGCVSDAPAPAPARFELLPNSPNPFNPSTRVAFTLAATESVRLAVHRADGRLVRVLLDAPRSQGTHTVLWDGRDASGRRAPSGVYVCRLQVGGEAMSRRMHLVK